MVWVKIINLIFLDHKEEEASLSYLALLLWPLKHDDDISKLQEHLIRL